jgi:uncharacterized protein YbjT (DUF2867 family)
MALRKILVTGATGKQGGAVINALIASPPPYDYEILALTRKASSPAAQKLASNLKVSLIEGDLNDCPAIFKKCPSIWGVFSVQVVQMAQGRGAPKDIEEKQGMALIDAAIASGVSHFVYSSVGSGGLNVEEEEERLNLKVPHFVSKYIVEKHLKEKAKGTNMTYTILQPVAFIDNFAPGMQGKAFGAMWTILNEKKLQVVATSDIGRFAAISFANPEHPDLTNKSITLVGDDLTASEANDVFFKALHRPMPRTYTFIVSIFMYFFTELGTMSRWFRDIGYKGDVAECKRINPKMLDLATWLKEEGQYKSWWST